MDMAADDVPPSTSDDTPSPAPVADMTVAEFPENVPRAGREQDALGIGLGRTLSGGDAGAMRASMFAAISPAGPSALGALRLVTHDAGQLRHSLLTGQCAEQLRLLTAFKPNLGLHCAAAEGARQHTELVERLAGARIEVPLLAIERSAGAALGALGRLVLEPGTLAAAWGIPILSPSSLAQQLGLPSMADLSRFTDEANRLLQLTSGAARYASDIAALRADQLERSSALRAAWTGMEEMTAAATRLWAGLALDPNLLMRLGPEIAAIAPLEMYGAARAYDALVGVDVDEEEAPGDDVLHRRMEELTDDFEHRLAALAPALVTMYRGAVERAAHGGADAARHVLSSLRELATQVLHALAPDAAVKAYAPEQLDEKGRPTRASRLQYVCRDVDGGDLTDFLKADLAAWGKQLQYLNKVHKPDVALSAAQAVVVVERLRGMLNAWLLISGR